MRIFVRTVQGLDNHNQAHSGEGIPELAERSAGVSKLPTIAQIFDSSRNTVIQTCQC